MMVFLTNIKLTLE